MNLMTRTPVRRRLAALTLAAFAAAALPAAFAQTAAQTPPPPGADRHDHTAPMQRTEPPVNEVRDGARMPPPPGDAIGPARFGELDANGDQKISRDEAALDARLAANFGVHDLDRDGVISLSEYQAGQTPRSDDR